MIMNKIIISILVAVAAMVTVFMIPSCGDPRPSKEDIEAAISDGQIPEDQYIELFRAYLDYNNMDAAVLDQYLEGNQDDIDLESLKEAEEKFHEYLLNTLDNEDVVVNRISWPKEQPVAVSIYLDNTSSMKGYLQPADKSVSVTAITDVMNGIKGYFDTDVPFGAWYVSRDKDQKCKLTEVEFEKMLTNVGNKTIQTQDAYPMDEFIGEIVNTCIADSAHSHVSFFITDGIPSGTNQEIAKDPSFNINQRNTLERRINEKLDKAKELGYGLSIYQFMGNFDGSYINYANKATLLKRATRPFYVIAIGDKNVLKKMADKVKADDVDSFKPVNSLHAFKQVGTPSVTIEEVKGAETGETYPVENGGTVKTDDNYNVALRIEGVPEFLNDTATLNRGALEITPKPLQSVDVIDGMVKVPGRNLKETTTMDVQVVYVTPAWVQDSNSEDDTDINSQLGKTFNLEVLVDGLLKGVSGISGNSIGEKVEFSVEPETK